MEPVPIIRASRPVLVFGGPYSNLEATAAVLAQAAGRDIPPENVICTGDLAAYCGDPRATIDLVRRSGIHVVLGNCDEQLGAEAGDCACGYASGSVCDRLAAAWYAHANAQLDAEARRWLASLPRRIVLEIAGRRLAVIHGGAERINRFIFASTDALIKRSEIERTGCDGVIAGHCGLPFTQVIDGRLWHNPGGIGLPANDGTPRVWYSVLTPSDRGLLIDHHALAYDHAAAAEAMTRAGLPPDYRETLATGLWPSCSVLPYPELRARGVPYEPGTCLWMPNPGGGPRRRSRTATAVTLWPAPQHRRVKPANVAKFRDPGVTATGARRASVSLSSLRTLWFNTGTLCNIACRNCYIESSPKNDRLAYLTVDDVRPYLDEIERDGLATGEIGFTGGEPFMNPQIIRLLEEPLSRGFSVLVLTNAMRPMMRWRDPLLALRERYGETLTVRVSLDHYSAERHEEERGPGTFAPTRDGLVWLARHGFRIAVAGRSMWAEDEESERAGFARLFAEYDIPLDAADPEQLVLFPEMDVMVDVPEITTDCWSILGKSPDDVMCATSRMVVRRKGAERPAVLACTLLPYDPAFELGSTLREASRAVPLNHPHCAKFCVLGGASCSRAKTQEAKVAERAA
jgi:predicted phosphodiesterase